MALALGGCGARTGLDVPNVDGSVIPPREQPDVGVCRPFRSISERASLDVFLLLDASGSMVEPTALGVTKAEAVAEALGAFVSAEESDGLGVALTFFPVLEPGVPAFCRNDRDCGAADTCFRPRICSDARTICERNADCPGRGSRCRRLRVCESFGGLCGSGFGPCPFGACIPFGQCLNRVSCEVEDYRTPTVELGVLPDAAGALLDGIARQQLGGSTPTLWALEGVLDQARARQRARPTSRVVVLLATDGFPTFCEIDLLRGGVLDAPTILAEVADAAARGAARGIDTHVVGVFGPEEEEEARANLSMIAEAGGSEEALVVSTDEPVSERLLRVLSDVREEVQRCAFAIPAAGALPDPRDLRVRLLSAGEPPVDLDRQAQCAPGSLAFTLDGDPDAGVRPGVVELCPAACARVTDLGARVEMEAGCR